MDNFLKLDPSNRDKLQREEANVFKGKPEILAIQPWVEKYRPNTLNDIVYQENVVNALKTTKETGKMQHLLFYGPPGTGKTSTVIALAKELFGVNYRERILELNASDERGIQVVRDKIKKFSQKIITKISNDTPAKFQIVILDEADSMTTEAQSALRRIIEDYTKQTRFCIICNYVSKIIAPIASRCAKFRFSPLSRESQLNRLKFISEQERVAVPLNVLKFLEEISEGDMRRSINLLQSISQLGNVLMSNESILNDVCGMIPKDEVGNLLLLCKTSSVNTLMNFSEVFYANGYDLRQLLVQLNDHIAKDDSITEEKKYKLFNVIMEKEIALLESSSAKILLFDLILQSHKILNDK